MKSIRPVKIVHPAHVPAPPQPASILLQSGALVRQPWFFDHRSFNFVSFKLPSTRLSSHELCNVTLQLPNSSIAPHREVARSSRPDQSSTQGCINIRAYRHLIRLSVRIMSSQPLLQTAPGTSTQYLSIQFNFEIWLVC